MNYFQAVQEGRARVKEAVELLQAVAGVSHPMLFLKMTAQEWTPVGGEMLQAIIPGKNGTAAVVLCDAEGNSKAMSEWLSAIQAEENSRALESKGVQRFDGEVRLPL